MPSWAKPKTVMVGGGSPGKSPMPSLDEMDRWDNEEQVCGTQFESRLPAAVPPADGVSLPAGPQVAQRQQEMHEKMMQRMQVRSNRADTATSPAPPPPQAPGTTIADSPPPRRSLLPACSGRSRCRSTPAPPRVAAAPAALAALAAGVRAAAQPLCSHRRVGWGGTASSSSTRATLMR